MNRTDYEGIRRAKGISLNDIFNDSRVSILNLEAIEKGEYSLLPAPVIGRAFIKIYALEVGVDPQELLDEYENFLRQKEPPLEKTDGILKNRFRTDLLHGIISFAKRKKKLLLQVAIVLAGIVVVAAVIKWMPSFISSDPSGSIPTSNTSSTVSTNNSTEEYNINIKASDTVWMRITTDNHSAEEVILAAGDTLEKKAMTRFIIEVGNAGGVKIYFQGKDLGVLGKKGELMRLVLPPLSASQPKNPHSANATTSFNELFIVPFRDQKAMRFLQEKSYPVVGAMQEKFVIVATVGDLPEIQSA